MIKKKFANESKVVVKKNLESLRTYVPDLGEDLDYMGKTHEELLDTYREGVLKNKYIKEIVSPGTAESGPAEENTDESRKKFDDCIKNIEVNLKDVENKTSIPEEEVKEARERLNELKNFYNKLKRHHQYTLKFVKCEEGVALLR